MARIPLRVAQRSLDPGSPVNYPSGSPVGAAVAGLGSTITGAASFLQNQRERTANEAERTEATQFNELARLAEIQQQREAAKNEFDAKIAENEFATAMGALEQTAVQNMPPDASGLHDSVYGKRSPQGGVAEPGSFDTLFDQFLERMPQAKRADFAAKRELYRAQGSNRLAVEQYKGEQAYYEVQIQKVQNDLTNAIAQIDPSDRATFRAFKAEGLDIIEKSGLAALHKDVAKQNWLAKSEEALAQAVLLKDPGRLREMLGVAPPTAPKAFEAPAASDASAIFAAMESVESSGRAGAVSEKGATGLMQVTPDTAREIGGELGDPFWARNPGPAEIENYLKNPAVSRRYGQHYFNKMLARYDGDVDAALVAYNGGMKRADAWLAAGRDDSVIPQESADYYKKVKARLTGGGAGGAGAAGAAGSAGAAAASGLDLPIITAGENRHGGGPDIDNVQPQMLGLFRQLQNAFGQSIPIASGYRDPGRNARAGGASKSRHMHGDALDLDVSKLSKEERVNLIRLASSMGFQGIGVYNNSIHLDLGNRRAWGPSHGRESVPGWAQAAIQEHEAGTATAPAVGVRQSQPDPDFANIPLERRLVLANRADVQVAEIHRAEATQQAAAYELHKDAINLSIAKGEIMDEAVVANDAILNDGDKATFIRSVREANAKGAQLRSDLTAFTAGALTLDPYASEDKKRADDLYAEMAKRVADPAQAGTVAGAIIEQTGVVPQPVLNTIRRGLDSQNPADVAAAAQLAQRIATVDSAALGRREGGEAVQRAADDFTYYVERLNVTPDEAARRLIDARDPQKQRDRKALEPAVKEFRKSLDETDLPDLFDDSMWSEPDVGFMPGSEFGIKAEFLAIAEDKFYEYNGNAELAKNAAEAEMKRLYGVTRLTGRPVVMKHPPERYWTQMPVPMGGWLGGETPISYAQRQLEADVRALDPTMQAGSLALVTTPETDRAIKRGEMPGYSVMWLDENGNYQTLPGQLWRPDTSVIQEQLRIRQENEQAERVRRAQERDVEARGAQDRLREIPPNVIPVPQAPGRATPAFPEPPSGGTQSLPERLEERRDNLINSMPQYDPMGNAF